MKKKSAENGHSRKLISHKEINCINGKEVNYSWCSLDHFLSMKSQFDSDLIVFSGDDFFYWFLVEIEARLTAITTAENSNKICFRPITGRGNRKRNSIKGTNPAKL